jgi:hypothetical protein
MVFENHLGNGWRKSDVGPPMLGEWRKQSTVFEGLAGRGRGSFILTERGQPESLVGARLSANIFSLLGVKPLLGRDFLPEEETYGRHFVVELSHELWQRRFGGDSNVAGQNITLDGEPYTVIGVMPPRTCFPERNTQLCAAGLQPESPHATASAQLARLWPPEAWGHAGASQRGDGANQQTPRDSQHREQRLGR